VFIHDRVTGTTTTWAEDAPAAQRPRDESRAPVLSYDGGVIAFQTRLSQMDRAAVRAFLDTL